MKARIFIRVYLCSPSHPEVENQTMFRPVAANRRNSTASLTLREDPQAFKPDPETVFVQSPWKLYAKASLSSLVVIFSLVFYGYIRKRGGLSAGPSVANAVLTNPRLSAQVVTVIASLLTGVVKWGLSRAITFTAQKRFLMSRSIYEAEVWSSLKNGGILWASWNQGWRRWMMSTFTTIVVILCGLMTSGFVTLLSPLPIPIKKQVVIVGESDAIVSAACSDWYTQAWDEVIQRAGELNRKNYKGFDYQYCGADAQIMDALDAGRAGMLAFIQPLSSADAQSFLTTFSRFGSVRILGSTAGIIPMGPAGIKPLSRLSSGSDSDDVEINSQPISRLRYSLVQQGVSINISCQYVDPSVLPYRWPLVRGSDNLYLLNTTCPGKSPRNRSIAAADNFLLADYCLDRPSQEWTIYLQSAFRFNEIPTLSSNTLYGGIGSMECKVGFQLSSIRSTYDSKLGGFRLSVEGDVGAKQLNDVFWETIHYVVAIFPRMQATNRNAVCSMVDSIAVSRYGLPGGARDERYPALVASMLKGLLEYQMTSQRLIPVLSTVPAPQECRANVSGSVEYSITGWNAQLSTFLALSPLILVSIALVLLIIRALWGDRRSETRLKVFDPTSPVSLIATASAGGTGFESTAVGDPDDETVRIAKVRYDKVGTERWGLMKED